MREREEFISRPVLSLQTTLRTVSMGNDHLIPIIPDGVFGPNTMASVTAFQRYFHLPVTGVVDLNTWNRLVQEFNHAMVVQGPAEPLLLLLEPGQVIVADEVNDHVYLIQSILTVLSRDDSAFPTPGITGSMDASTVESVRHFQQLADLPMTGNVDKHTWQHLAKQYSSTAKDGTTKKRCK